MPRTSQPSPVASYSAGHQGCTKELGEKGKERGRFGLGSLAVRSWPNKSPFPPPRGFWCGDFSRGTEMFARVSRVWSRGPFPNGPFFKSGELVHASCSPTFVDNLSFWTFLTGMVALLSFQLSRALNWEKKVKQVVQYANILNLGAAALVMQLYWLSVTLTTN